MRPHTHGIARVHKILRGDPQALAIWVSLLEGNWVVTTGARERFTLLNLLIIPLYLSTIAVKTKTTESRLGSAGLGHRLQVGSG